MMYSDTMTIDQGAVNMENTPLSAVWDFGHDSWFSTCNIYNSSWKCYQLSAEQLLTMQSVQKVQITVDGVLSRS